MRIEIKARITGAILFAHEAEGNTLKLTLEKAVELRAYLGGAYLGGAYLGGAYLRGADLGGADLGGADLGGADLGGGEKIVGERPMLQIGPIGSRNDYLVAFLTDHGIRIQTGCFFGDRAEFEAAIAKTHSDNGHGSEYRAALAMIDVHARLWTPAVEKQELAS